MATILLVHDTPLNLELLETLCRYGGHTTWRAESVVAALTLSRAYRPDLIIADLHMAPLDGYDLLRAVKDDPQLAHIPFLMVSMSGGHGRDSAKAKSLGAGKFIATPVESQVMLAKINACLGISEASDSPGHA